MIKSKTLKKTVQMTLIKVNQLPARLVMGINIEDHSEGKEVEIIKLQGEALIIITILHPGEAAVDIKVEVTVMNK
jgi:hypothetical protein